MSIKYQVIEIGTGRVIAEYSTRKRASTKSDKLDLEYGAIKYGVKVVERA